MITQCFQKSRFPVAAILMTILAACGGGDSTTQDSTASLLTPYVGTWKSGCDTFEIGSDGNVVGSTDQSIVGNALASDGSMKAVTSYRYYSTADCSGTAIGTITAVPASITPNGTKAIGSSTVVKVDVDQSVAKPTLSGTAVSFNAASTTSTFTVSVKINGVEVDTVDQNDITGSFKTVFSPVTGNSFTLGSDDEDDGFDANGYPKTLSTAPAGTYTKQ